MARVKAISSGIDEPVIIDGQAPVGADELLGFAQQLWQSHDPAHVPLTTPGDRAVVSMAVGWWRTTFRQGEACARLVRDDMTDAAVANARSAFEHAVYISALAQCADDGCAGQFLEAREAEGLRTTRLALADTEPTVDPGLEMLRKLFDATPDRQVPKGFEWANSLEVICQRLRGRDPLLYVSYRLMCGLTHAGFPSASVHFWELLDESLVNKPVAPRRRHSAYGRVIRGMGEPGARPSGRVENYRCHPADHRATRPQASISGVLGLQRVRNGGSKTAAGSPCTSVPCRPSSRLGDS